MDDDSDSEADSVSNLIMGLVRKGVGGYISISGYPVCTQPADMGDMEYEMLTYLCAGTLRICGLKKRSMVMCRIAYSCAFCYFF